MGVKRSGKTCLAMACVLFCSLFVVNAAAQTGAPVTARSGALSAPVPPGPKVTRPGDLVDGSALAERARTDALDYSSSLALRTDHVVADSARPLAVRLEQIYLPPITLERTLTAHVVLRQRPMSAAGAAPEQPGEVVKDFGTFARVGRDLREQPFVFELDVHTVPGGRYQVSVDITNGSVLLGTSTLNIALRKGLDDIVSRLESEAKKAPADVRPEILFPVDRMRNVNRGLNRELLEGCRGECNRARLELRTFDPEKEFAAAEAIVSALEAKQDPFAKRTGDLKRHYLFGPAGEVMPYRLYVPTTYKGSQPFPLIIALHGLGGSEDEFFDGDEFIEGYEKKLPEFAEQHGYIVVAPLGYRINGQYGWGLGNPPADQVTRRVQAYSEQDVMQVLQRVRQQYRVDENRVYLMGYSMGGYGTWRLAAKYPDIWAAIAPISGAGQPATIERFRQIPEIVVHGDNDSVVNVSGSRTMVEKMKELGVEVKYVEVPGGTHHSVVAPNIEAILEFFDAHKKNTKLPQ